MPYDPEKRKAYYLSFRNWLIQNPEANQHYREYNREYRKKHKTQIRENQKNYRETHREQRRKNWNKCNAKRKRSLGFIPLNDPFSGSVAHHIDLETIVYIPKELHVSISHSVLKNYGMELINDKALKWLIEHDVSR